MKKIINIPAILHMLSGIIAVSISLFFNFRIQIYTELAKAAGLIIFFIGMIILIWALIYIRKIFFGTDNSEIKVPVNKGPYKFIRHPVYFGMLIALLGIAVFVRSWAGLICLIILFLPSVIYRAVKEEKYLSVRYGDNWKKYCNSTGFFFPVINKKEF